MATCTLPYTLSVEELDTEPYRRHYYDPELLREEITAKRHLTGLPAGKFSDEFKELLDGMLRVKPEERLTIP